MKAKVKIALKGDMKSMENRPLTVTLHRSNPQESARDNSHAGFRRIFR